MFQGVIFVQTWYHAQWNLTCAIQCHCIWHTSFTICTFQWGPFQAVAGISPFSTLILFISEPRNNIYFTWNHKCPNRNKS